MISIFDETRELPDMAQRDHLVAGIRKQQELLSELIHELRSKDRFDSEMCSIYEFKTKEVAKNLKRLRKIAAEELVKEIRVKNDETSLAAQHLLD